jgi:hypothetical protein
VRGDVIPPIENPWAYSWARSVAAFAAMLMIYALAFDRMSKV